MRWLVILILVFSDILLVFLLGNMLSALQGTLGQEHFLPMTAVSGVVYVVWVGMRVLLGLYPGYGLDQPEELRRQTYAVAATLATVSVFALMFPPYFALVFYMGSPLSRLLLVLGFLGLLFFAPLLRYFVKLGLRKVGLWGKPVAILGADEVGRDLVRTLQREWNLGYNPVAVFDNRLAPVGGALEGVPYGGTLTDAMRLARKRKVDTAILAMSHARPKRFASLISRASANFRYVIVIPTHLSGITTSAVVARDLSGTLGVELKHNLLSPWAQRVKRALDLWGVVVGGLLISPLLLVMVALIKLDSPGPAFYWHQRLGRRGKHFRCWKFRTMHTDAESLLTNLLQSNVEVRSEWEKNQKLRKDPRVTRIGRFLRKTSLDELPQLWNVLRGEMSLVGPRPIVDAEVPKYYEVYKLYRRVPPGISGLWQVSGRSDTSYEERVAMDAYYVRNWSVWLDLVILARTVKSVISSWGAY
jgi:Undecaprenyl-phosphate galactose phosphotransferase WbaP